MMTTEQNRLNQLRETARNNGYELQADVLWLKKDAKALWMLGYGEISEMLQSIGQGLVYNARHLRIAKSLPEITPEDRKVLESFLDGSYARNGFESRMALQDIAIKLIKTKPV
jgi:hypothetical protein